MGSTKEIQTRMKSIQDTMKITNAMYMISSTKLRKAKKNLEETEPYFYTLQTMVSRIVRHLPEIDNKYFDERKDKPAGEKTTGLIVVTADKGLAGAYNHNVLKMAEEQMQKAVLPGGHALLLLQKLQRFLFKGPAQQIVNVRKIIVEMLPPHPTGIHDLRHGDPFQRLLGHGLLQRTADGLTSGLGGFIPFSHLTAPFR